MVHYKLVIPLFIQLEICSLSIYCQTVCLILVSHNIWTTNKICMKMTIAHTLSFIQKLLRSKLNIATQYIQPYRCNPKLMLSAFEILCISNVHYGNTGCGVFNGGIQSQKGFWLKINCSQMKLLNFEKWSTGELSKIGHHFRK